MAQASGMELVLERDFDAPREKLWRAWSDPELMKRWWGPREFTAPSITIDFRAGGGYLFCMRSPDGKDSWSTGVYREIVPMQRIVCTDSFADEHGAVVPASHYDMPGDWPRELLITVTFEQHDGGTRMSLRQAGLPSEKMLELTREGWIGSFDKLADTLE